MAKKFMLKIPAVGLILVLLIPSHLFADSLNVRAADTSDAYSKDWVGYRGQLRLSEKDFFATAGHTEWAETARIHAQNRLTNTIFLSILTAAGAGALAWAELKGNQLHPYQTAKYGGIAISTVGIICLIFARGPANALPLGAALEAARDYNSGSGK